MKKITFMLFVMLSSWQITAQVSSYVFSQTSGTYTPITGGLLLGTTTSDDQKFLDPAVLAGGTGNTGVGLPIGFDFTFNGLVFDRVGVNNNGWISLGQSALTPAVDINSSSAYTPLASTAANTPSILRNRIAGIAADLQGQTGSSIRIETIGTAPNRTLVVQWTNYRRYLQTGSNLSFQIRLNETVNTVDVVFDTLTFNATSSTAHIGLGGTVSTDFDNRTTTTNWNTTIAGTTNAATCTFVTGTVTPPTPGLTLTWTPGPVCAGMPNAGTSLPASLLLLPTQAVGNLVVSDYTQDVSGLTFQWQESLDNGVSWNNATGGTNATTPTYTPPAFAGTSIQYRLAVTCSATGDVAFSTISNIQACGAYSVPVLEPLTTFLPTCWQEADNGDLTAGPAVFLSGSWLVDGFANSGTTGAARVTLDGAADNDWVISPLFTIPAVGYELKFDAAATQTGGTGLPTTPWESDDFVEVLVSTTTNNWTLLYTYNDTNVPSNIGAANILDLDAYSGQDVRFAFRAVEGASNGAAAIDFFIDNFEIRLSPLCPDQTGLIVSNVTSSGADTSWDDMSLSGAIGYQYAITTSATPPASGTGTASTFYIASGLLPQTVYYLHVRSECAASTYGNWATTTFTTACAPLTTLPWVENFDALTTGTNIFPACWAYTNALSTWSISTTPVANSGANSLRRTWSTDGWAFTPTATLTAGTSYRFSYFVRTNDAIVGYDITVGVGTSQTSAAMTTTLSTVTGYQGPAWVRVNHEFTPTVTGDYSFGIRVVAPVAPNGINFDDFRLELSPTCPDQTGLVVANVTSTGADTSWDDMSLSGAVGYEYAVTTSATPPASGTATTSTFYIASGLLPQTVYYLHVRSECSGSTYGVWATTTFTTACSPLTSLPWLENFDTLTPGTNVFPSCWNYSNTASTWSISTTPVAYSGANSLRRTWSTNGWAFTPMFSLTAGTSYTFSYFVRTNDTTVGYDVTVGVGNSQNSAAMTTTLSNVVGYQGPAWTLVTLEYTPPVSGDYSFGVHVVAPVAPNGINFDNFELKLTPACPAPIASASGVTDVAANLSWAAIPSATLGYEYVLDNVATDPVVAGTSTTSITYAASGLTPLTTYYFHIRSVCAVGTYSTWTTISFTTLATPPVNDNCATATVLTPGATFAVNPLVATNVGSTGSTETAPGCASYLGGDVWYSVVVPASGNITLETATNAGTTITDTGLAVYSGTCGSLVLVLCDDDTGTGNFSLISLTGRTAGELLYVRAWEFGNDAFNTFQISAYDASLSAASFDKSTFVAYPNPVKDVLNLSYKTAISNVKVINLLGQEVLNTKTNTNDVQVNMSALTAGAYIVNITVEDTVHTIKVIKE